MLNSSKLQFQSFTLARIHLAAHSLAASNPGLLAVSIHIRKAMWSTENRDLIVEPPINHREPLPRTLIPQIKNHISVKDLRHDFATPGIDLQRRREAEPGIDDCNVLLYGALIRIQKCASPADFI